jgi:hypothetical protein
MNVWVIFPSANHDKAEEAQRRWKAQGYNVATLFDGSDPYRGYWHSINRLVKDVGNKADIFVAAADDIDPDMSATAEEIGDDFLLRFPGGFGVMQPCGDPQGEIMDGKHAAARICGSPWFGRGWVERAYGGRGPMPTEYFHFYGDEELKNVAEKLGVLWMRPDLTQFHRHWSWGHSKQADYQKRNSAGHWTKDRMTFMQRQAQGFPGHEPLKVGV